MCSLDARKCQRSHWRWCSPNIRIDEIIKSVAPHLQPNDKWCIGMARLRNLHIDERSTKVLDRRTRTSQRYWCVQCRLRTRCRGQMQLFYELLSALSLDCLQTIAIDNARRKTAVWSGKEALLLESPHPLRSAAVAVAATNSPASHTDPHKSPRQCRTIASSR